MSVACFLFGLGLMPFPSSGARRFYSSSRSSLIYLTLRWIDHMGGRESNLERIHWVCRYPYINPISLRVGGCGRQCIVGSNQISHYPAWEGYLQNLSPR